MLSGFALDVFRKQEGQGRISDVISWGRESSSVGSTI